MSRKKPARARRPEPPSETPSAWSARAREGAGVLVGAFGLYLLVCLLSYDRLDPSLNAAAGVGAGAVRNAGGVVGAYLSDAMIQVFGLGSYVLVALVLVASVRTVVRKPLGWRGDRILAYAVAMTAASILLEIVLGTVPLGGFDVAAGGVVGELAGGVLVDYVSVVGAVLLAGSVLIFSVAIVTGGTVAGMAAGAWAILWKGAGLAWGFTVAAVQQTGEWLTSWWETRRDTEPPSPRIVEHGPRFVEAALPAAPPVEEASLEPAGGGLLDIVRENEGDGPRIVMPHVVGSRSKKKKRRAGSAPKQPQPAGEEYGLPGLALLESEEQVAPVIDRGALKASAENLEQKFKDFGIYGRIVEIHPGPVITMFEFEPAPGIKISKIAGLSDDLKMAMRALSVRIVAPLPGKGTVGIEIPNRTRETVYLKDILGHGTYAQRRTPLPLALGKDISGKPVVSDLRSMPHLLVAGTTGSGKSVAVNSMLISMLYRSTPDQVRLLMIDPKMLEFGLYDGIPHLLLPVITNPKQASVALKWAVTEMERRYRLLADIGARDIDRYNDRIPKILEQRAQQEAEQKDDEPEDAIRALLADDEAKPLEHGHLPNIVIVIDELADLMLVAKSDVEESITRLAQMARAAGIHLMIATQRPSVDVLTGLIKANFPSRIAFRVASKVDSRTILDDNGAEALLGRGDMLFKGSDSWELKRIHGPLVTDAEVARIVAFLKDQGDPEYDEQILKPQASGDGSGGTGGEEADELYDQAIAIVAEHRIASISFLQRKLRVGYNRAARMIERMESDGIVSAPDGPKGRKVLIQHIPA